MPRPDDPGVGFAPRQDVMSVVPVAICTSALVEAASTQGPQPWPDVFGFSSLRSLPVDAPCRSPRRSCHRESVLRFAPRISLLATLATERSAPRETRTPTGETPHKALNLAGGVLVVSRGSRLSVTAGFLGRSGRFETTWMLPRCCHETPSISSLVSGVSRSSPARPFGVLEDRADDVSPVGSIYAVTGSLERQQPRIWNLRRQRLAVLEREHRIRGAVDHERGHGDR